MNSWTLHLDAWIAASLAPLAVVILVSGADDLFLILVWAWTRLRARRRPEPPPPGADAPDASERRIAVFVPLWHEHEVIGGMLDHNLHAIRHPNVDFFVGAYPNDTQTVAAIRNAESRHPRVHLALCPHDGPTSKADCLNWIYQRMLLHEEEFGSRFDIIVTHDAEDLIHPEALGLIARESARYAMVQIPVLPLATPLSDIVHGVYIDEFSEYQIKDMPAREALGAFVPSNGVGTGFRRDALEKLAASSQNRIFEPVCLTEDYENGLRLRLLGCSQRFVPLERINGSLVATREFFPRAWSAAIRQRTRWVTGISLQCWERNGWRGGLRIAYWFWRDRKGLIGNPASLLTNLILVYGAATWTLARAAGRPWGLAQHAPHLWFLPLTWIPAAAGLVFRAGCVAHLYNWRLALGVPFRVPVANAINTLASLSALRRYVWARLRGQPLRWIKTSHAYPTLAALREHKRKLGEILVTSSWISQQDLDHALASQPAGLRLGEHLVLTGLISEDDLYDALSLQQGLPAGKLLPREVRRNAVRALPRGLTSRYRVLPFKIDSGALFLASPEIPTQDLTDELRGFTRLELRFHLVTPSNFEELEESAV